MNSADVNSVGVVTISFNQCAYLAEAIASVTMTDNSKHQYVVVDPGSTDSSRQIIHENKKRFSSVVLEPDNGPADGLNKGFAKCDADVMGYLNADDRLLPGALDFVLDYFNRHPYVDVIMGGIRLVDQSGKVTRRSCIPWMFSPQSVLDGTYVAVQQGTFFRRRAWELTTGFNIKNGSCWDTELVLDMSLAGAVIRPVYKNLADFRIHSQSITGSNSLAARYRHDVERLKQKCEAAGFVRTKGVSLAAKQIRFRYSPVRRGLELLSSI